MMVVIPTNKLLIFPLAIMYIASIFIFVEASVAPSGDTKDFSTSNGITINGSTITDGGVLLRDAESHHFDVWGLEGMIVILLLAISVGVVAGISIIGSGLSGSAQKMVFVSILFFGIWTVLTVVTSSMMFDNIVTQILWLGMTMLFTVGLGMELTSSDGADE
jgi:hypothetical protein